MGLLFAHSANGVWWEMAISSTTVTTSIQHFGSTLPFFDSEHETNNEKTKLNAFKMSVVSLYAKIQTGQAAKRQSAFHSFIHFLCFLLF